MRFAVRRHGGCAARKTEGRAFFVSPKRQGPTSRSRRTGADDRPFLQVALAPARPDLNHQLPATCIDGRLPAPRGASILGRMPRSDAGPPLIVTSAMVADALRATSSIDGSSPRDLIRAARQSWQKVVPTLVSAWQHEGRVVSPALTYEAELYRRRAVRFTDVLGELEDVARVQTIKGLRVAARYPREIVRRFDDLDVCARTNDDLWRAARWLLESRWELHAISLVHADGADRFSIVFSRESEDAFISPPERVELNSLMLLGNLLGVPASTRMELNDEDPLALDLLMLVVENLDRPYAARDVVDAAVMLAHADSASLHALCRGIDAHHLWREWSRLHVLLNRLGLLPVNLFAPPTSVRRARARIQRVARATGQLASPSRAAVVATQLALIRLRRFSKAQRSASLEHAVSAAARLNNVDRLRRRGIPLFGLMIDDAEAQVLTIEERAGALLARTPIGAFAFVPGNVVREEWLEPAGWADLDGLPG